MPAPGPASINIAAHQTWLLTQALLWGCTLVLFPWNLASTGRAAWQFGAVGGGMAVSFAALWIILGTGRKLADYVTLLRFVGLLVVTGLAWHAGEVTWALWGALVVVVCADLLDGYCARKFGGSDAGAVLDMEADQFTTLALALLLHGIADISAWVLMLPGYRYLYVALMHALGEPAHDPKPCDGDNSRAKLICALVMGLMLLGLFPLAGEWVRIGAVATAVLLLAYSYGSDVVFLLRRSRETDETQS